MRTSLRFVEALTDGAGRLAAWIFFLIGFCIAYEVVMRYFLTSPTIWVDEVARIGQVWATFLAAAYVLRHRDMIVIDVAFRKPGTIGRKCADTFALAVIVMFCAVTVRYGFDLWLQATRRGHTTDTYLALPLWFTDASVWVGFLLLGLQSAAEAIKIWRHPAAADEAGIRR